MRTRTAVVAEASCMSATRVLRSDPAHPSGFHSRSMAMHESCGGRSLGFRGLGFKIDGNARVLRRAQQGRRHGGVEGSGMGGMHALACMRAGAQL